MINQVKFYLLAAIGLLVPFHGSFASDKPLVSKPKFTAQDVDKQLTAHLKQCKGTLDVVILDIPMTLRSRFSGNPLFLEDDKSEIFNGIERLRFVSTVRQKYDGDNLFEYSDAGDFENLFMFRPDIEKAFAKVSRINEILLSHYRGLVKFLTNSSIERSERLRQLGIQPKRKNDIRAVYLEQLRVVRSFANGEAIENALDTRAYPALFEAYIIHEYFYVEAINSLPYEGKQEKLDRISDIREAENHVRIAQAKILYPFAKEFAAHLGIDLIDDLPNVSGGKLSSLEKPDEKPVEKVEPKKKKNRRKRKKKTAPTTSASARQEEPTAKIDNDKQTESSETIKQEKSDPITSNDKNHALSSEKEIEETGENKRGVSPEERGSPSKITMSTKKGDNKPKEKREVQPQQQRPKKNRDFKSRYLPTQKDMSEAISTLKHKNLDILGSLFSGRKSEHNYVLTYKEIHNLALSTARD